MLSEIFKSQVDGGSGRRRTRQIFYTPWAEKGVEQPLQHSNLRDKPLAASVKNWLLVSRTSSRAVTRQEEG